MIQAKSICICIRLPAILLVIDLRKLKCYKTEHILSTTHFSSEGSSCTLLCEISSRSCYLGEVLKREPQAPARWSHHCTELQWQLCWAVWLNSCLYQPKKEDSINLSRKEDSGIHKCRHSRLCSLDFFGQHIEKNKAENHRWKHHGQCVPTSTPRCVLLEKSQNI